MKRQKVFLILAAAFLYGFGVLFCQSSRETACRSYLLLTQPIDALRAEEIFSRESALSSPLGFCFWGETTQQGISCKETGSAAEVSRVLLAGNPELLDAGKLYWQKGCFLDEDTAYSLFGTVDCSWQTVEYAGRSYRVFGTVSAARPTMLTLAEKADGAVLNRCVLDIPAESGNQAARQFLLRWDLKGDIIDYYPLWTVVYDSLLLFPCFLILKLCFPGKKQGQTTVKRAVRYAAGACLLLILAGRIRFVPDMFPSRWSDFSFWDTWWAEQSANIQQILRTPMGEGHLQMLLDMVKSMLCTLGALFLSLAAMYIPQGQDPSQRHE